MKLITYALILFVARFTHDVAGFAIYPAIMARPAMTPTCSSRMSLMPTLAAQNHFRLHASASESGESSIQLIGKEEMEEILDDYEQGDSGYCVLDVRTEEEVEATGKLSEKVITCPLPKLKQVHAFELHPEDFEEEFGFPKPHFDETLVFTCAAGKRAQMAAELAAIDGYPNIVVYTGGANEWFGPPSPVDVP